MRARKRKAERRGEVKERGRGGRKKKAGNRRGWKGGAYVHTKTMKSFLACCPVSSILSSMLKSAHLRALNGAQVLHFHTTLGQGDVSVGMLSV